MLFQRESTSVGADMRTVQVPLPPAVNDAGTDAIVNDEPSSSILVTPMPASNKAKGRTTRCDTVKGWNLKWLAFEEDNGFVQKVWCTLCRKHSSYDMLHVHPGQKQLCEVEAFVAGTQNVKKRYGNGAPTVKAPLKMRGPRV